MCHENHALEFLSIPNYTFCINSAAIQNAYIRSSWWTCTSLWMCVKQKLIGRHIFFSTDKKISKVLRRDDTVQHSKWWIEPNLCIFSLNCLIFSSLRLHFFFCSSFFGFFCYFHCVQCMHKCGFRAQKSPYIKNSSWKIKFTCCKSKNFKLLHNDDSIKYNKKLNNKSNASSKIGFESNVDTKRVSEYSNFFFENLSHPRNLSFSPNSWISKTFCNKWSKIMENHRNFADI